jgi:hypothetical protein
VGCGLAVDGRFLRMSQGDTDASQRCGGTPNQEWISARLDFPSGGHLHVVFVHGAQRDVVELEFAVESGAADS